MVKRHPDSTFLTEYAAGSLSIAPCISVTTHLQYCDECRAEVESLQDVGGELLAKTPAMPVSEQLLDSVLGSLDDNRTMTPARTRAKPAADQHDLPAYVRQFLPAELKWRKLSPSLTVAPVSVGEDRYELGLHRIEAGGKAPEHDHKGLEITVVLQGSFSDEDGIYREGDFLVREPGDVHRPHAAQHESCICLSVLEAPIRLTGIKRILNPFMQFAPS